MEKNTTDIINNLKDMPAMPNIIIQALNIVKNPNSSIADLGKIISYDQSLSIKVLNFVNSAFYGFAQQISSITRALALLGMNKAKNIIITVAMKPLFSSERNKDLWEHAITVAIGCQYLASHFKILDPDDAFVIGFMHDIGKTVLNMQNTEVADKVKEFVNDGSDIIETEKAFFKTTHTEVGALLAIKWKLPLLITNAIKYHHNPMASSMPKECTLVYIVDTLTQENFDTSLINEKYTDLLNIKLEKPEILRESIISRANMLIRELSD